MTRRELKQLIREVVEEVAASASYDVEIYLPNGKRPEAVIETSAKDANSAKKSAEKYLFDNFVEMSEMHSRLYKQRVPRQDLVYKVVKTG